MKGNVEDLKKLIEGIDEKELLRYFNLLGYISFNKLLSFLARIFILLSDRGLGKSHGFKKFLFKLYLTLGWRFVCLYRTKNDRDSAVRSWVDQFIYPPEGETFGPFDKESFKWRRQKHCVELYYKEDTQPIGYFLCIAHVNAIKQMVFPDNIHWGWFDEMLPEAWTKLPGIDNEGKAILKIMDTIEHDTLHRKLNNGYPRVRWMFFGNMTSLRSPLLQYFGVKPYKYGFYRGQLNGITSKDVMIEHVPPVIPQNIGNYSNAARIYLLDEAENAFIAPKPTNKLQISIRIKIDSEIRYYHVYDGGGINNKWICSANKHKGEIRVGTLIGKREDEIRVFDKTRMKMYLSLFSSNLLLFDNVYTKMNFINDII